MDAVRTRDNGGVSSSALAEEKDLARSARLFFAKRRHAYSAFKRCCVTCVTTEFDLERFVDDPTLEQLDSCREADLVLIAEYFKIDVSRSETKRQIKTKVTEGLLERQILFEGADPGKSTLIKTESPDTTTQTRQFELEMRHLDLREKEVAAQARLREKELEANVRLRELEVEAMRAGSRAQPTEFSISRNVSMVPPFREVDVDTYFPMFERAAITLSWPRDAWPLMLQGVLVGKAQVALSSLSLEQSLDYDMVKVAVLRAHELVPEAYRQKSRQYRKADRQTFVEFAREKENVFDRWCVAQGTKTFEQLRDLIIMEEFRNCVPERVAIYLNEQRVTQIGAIVADAFTITHRGVFRDKSPPRHDDVTPQREFPVGSVGLSETGALVSGDKQEDLRAKRRMLR
ncbi:hypothetical protein SKAU_G00271660 [Synaphobranchus kaupii]|uniref:SCAN box domain-containing protein n=1 Tax=Synaphobranchus kaupii TaxID=118154 RepID=A0A9Q1F0D3_SYNKA|nr:hypothetical protein SKAU_G00271660 [Synaphobranchus kaupii]